MTNTQSDRDTLHSLLVKAGSNGVNSWDATYVLGCGKQAPTRYSELKYHPVKNPNGCHMDKPRRNRNRSVNWIHLGCKGYVVPVKPVYVPEWQQVDNRVQVWSVKLGRYTWEIKKDPEQIDLLTLSQQ